MERAAGYSKQECLPNAQPAWSGVGMGRGEARSGAGVGVVGVSAGVFESEPEPLVGVEGEEVGGLGEELQSIFRCLCESGGDGEKAERIERQRRVSRGVWGASAPPGVRTGYRIERSGHRVGFSIGGRVWIVGEVHEAVVVVDFDFEGGEHFEAEHAGDFGTGGVADAGKVEGDHVGVVSGERPNSMSAWSPRDLAYAP